MVQSPSRRIGCPLGFFTVPRKSPLYGSNALILPSPKFPINNEPPSSPKPAGASATPQGELSTPNSANRLALVLLWKRQFPSRVEKIGLVASVSQFARIR